jgi:Cof subfamily protein (haloacid dehalogenase superfamily)
MYKVVFCDIDGTIKPRHKKISSRTEQAVKKLININVGFVLCTGRSRPMAMELAKQVDNFGYIICSNGADVYNYKTDIQIFKDTLNLKAIKRLLKISQKTDSDVLIKCGKNNYKNRDFVSESPAEIVTIKQAKKLFLEGVVQINIMNWNKQQMLNIINQVEKMKDVVISNRTKSFIDKNFADPTDEPFYIDVNNVGCSKGLGISKLTQFLQMSAIDTISIGDSTNDLSMFEQSGTDVAVENSITELKNKADHITKSNEEHGVAVFLEEYFNL